jgi:hypothetical protein
MTWCHDDVMASLASLPLPVEQPGTFEDPLVGDRIGYDAWLLPPKKLEPAERIIRFCSMLVGPVIFLAELALFIDWII